MANVCQIVELINKSIKSIDALKGIDVNGIASIVKNDKKITVPCIISDDGETKYVGVDDAYSGVMYHRILSTSWDKTKENNYGDGFNRKLEQHEMVLVAYVKLPSVRIQQHEFASILNASFPTVIEKSAIENLDIFSAIVDMKSVPDYDSESIYKQEYNTESPLSAESYMIKIKYDITMKVNANCKTLC